MCEGVEEAPPLRVQREDERSHQPEVQDRVRATEAEVEVEAVEAEAEAVEAEAGVEAAPENTPAELEAHQLDPARPEA